MTRTITASDGRAARLVLLALFVAGVILRLIWLDGRISYLHDTEAYKVAAAFAEIGTIADALRPAGDQRRTSCQFLQ